ncbi:hypothetical protein [Microvirga alba]|uniref:Uncharacterized protein n=1 Tax=Microvirga alba TaxID=2791025 RepID=A0A931BRQ2_9HYPH|nr:hypothetical protein [Microvirga alba]MBF9234474.1 hypothetical protein [Microvirga alba]
MGVGQQGDERKRQTDIGTEEWSVLKDEVGGIAGAAVDRGRLFIDAAREQATHYAGRRKDDVAQSVADFATSLRDATSSFDDRQNIRAVVDSAAEGLEQLADTIREHNFADIVGAVEDIARRRPGVVAALSITVGFLTARFIKSTAEDLREDRSSHRTGGHAMRNRDPRLQVDA